MNDKKINIVIWLLMAGMLGWFFYAQGWILANFKNVSPQEAKVLLSEDNNLTLVDVRTPYAFKKDFIDGAVNVPLYKLKTDPTLMQKYKNRKILLYSERGEESIEVARLLKNQGYTFLNLKSGIVFWLRAGYVLRRP